MTDERELHPTEQTRRESSGDYLWRVLKPAGCVFVLLTMILFLVFCFTYRHDPAEDAPASSAVSETAAPDQRNGGQSHG